MRLLCHELHNRKTGRLQDRVAISVSFATGEKEMTVYVVLYGRPTNLKYMGSYDALDDAVACALKAGAMFNDNKMESFQQSNKRVVHLNTSRYDCVVFIERVEDGIIK